MKSQSKIGSFFSYSDLWDHRYNKLSNSILFAMNNPTKSNISYAQARAKKLGYLSGKTIRIEKLRVA